jgi:Domain of Unknown Function (DUF1206)
MNGLGAIEWLARMGFLVKGVLYIVIGALALQVAAGAGGRLTGSRGALTSVLGQPFGRTLLLVAAIGLLGYAAWRVLQGLFAVAGWSRDPSEAGTTTSSLRTLAEQPGALGGWLLAVTAAGFVAYGFFEIIHARYLHIQRVR